MKAVTIKTNGERAVIEFKFGEYEYLSEAVGGMIGCVHLRDKSADMWVNDNFLAEGLPLNPTATALYADNYGIENAYICGDVIITGDTDDEGETLGLSDEQVDYYLTYSSMVINFLAV